MQDTHGITDTTLDAVAGTATSSSSTLECCRPVLANCAVLCVLHRALVAAADALAAPAVTTDSYSALTALVPDIAALLLRLQRMVQQLQAAAAAGDATVDTAAATQLQLWLLRVWQQLLRVPAAGLAGLQQQQLDEATQQLVQISLHGSCMDVQLPMMLPTTNSSSSSNAQAAAAAALQRLAAVAVPADANAASSLKALQRHAAPLLLELLQARDSSGEEGAELSGRALDLLQQVAGSSAAAAWQVLSWLQPLVLVQLQQGDMVRRATQMIACCMEARGLAQCLYWLLP